MQNELQSTSSVIYHCRLTTTDGSSVSSVSTWKPGSQVQLLPIQHASSLHVVTAPQFSFEKPLSVHAFQVAFDPLLALGWDFL